MLTGYVLLPAAAMLLTASGWRTGEKAAGLALAFGVAVTLGLWPVMLVYLGTCLGWLWWALCQTGPVEPPELTDDGNRG